MRRSAVTLADVAEWHNLVAAFWQASRGKAARADVAASAVTWTSKSQAYGKTSSVGPYGLEKCEHFAFMIRSLG